MIMRKVPTLHCFIIATFIWQSGFVFGSLSPSSPKMILLNAIKDIHFHWEINFCNGDKKHYVLTTKVFGFCFYTRDIRTRRINFLDCFLLRLFPQSAASIRLVNQNVQNSPMDLFRLPSQLPKGKPLIVEGKTYIDWWSGCNQRSWKFSKMQLSLRIWQWRALASHHEILIRFI